MASAQTGTTPYLQLTMPEDDMEMSSDLDRHVDMDDDIDIDIDLTEEQAPAQQDDDDYIIEDAKSELEGDHRSVTEVSHDDIMLDEDAAIDEDLTLQDEEIYDATDAIREETPTAQSYYPDHNAPTQLAEESSREDVPTLENVHGIENSPAERVESAKVDESTISRDPPSPNIPLPEESSDRQDHSADNEHATEGNSHEADETAIENSPNSANASLSYEQGNSSQPPLFADENPSSKEPDPPAHHLASAELATEATAAHAGDETTESKFHLHPVVILYQGNEMSLFPPSNQDASDTFLLQDESLAHGSLFDLLIACRSILADSIGEEDELEITSEELGLSVSEDSQHASVYRLSQILDMYVRLLQNDDVHSPEPFYVTLSTKVRFSKRFDDLASAVSEGKGLSQLPFWDEIGDGDYIAADTDDSFGQDGAAQSEPHPAEDSEDIHDVRTGNEEAHAGETGNEEPINTHVVDDEAGSDTHFELPDFVANESPADPKTATESNDGIDAQDHTVARTAESHDLTIETFKGSEAAEQEDDAKAHDFSLSPAGGDYNAEAEDEITYEDEDADETGEKTVSTGSSTLQGDDSQDAIEGPTSPVKRTASNSLNTDPEISRTTGSQPSGLSNTQIEDTKTQTPGHSHESEDLGDHETQEGHSAEQEDQANWLEDDVVHEKEESDAEARDDSFDADYTKQNLEQSATMDLPVNQLHSGNQDASPEPLHEEPSLEDQNSANEDLQSHNLDYEQDFVEYGEEPRTDMQPPEYTVDEEEIAEADSFPNVNENREHDLEPNQGEEDYELVENTYDHDPDERTDTSDPQIDHGDVAGNSDDIEFEISQDGEAHTSATVENDRKMSSSGATQPNMSKRSWTEHDEDATGESENTDTKRSRSK